MASFKEIEDAAGGEGADNAGATDALMRRWVELGLLISWVNKQSGAEINDLSRYIESETEKLVESFQDISGKAGAQADIVKTIVETSTNVVMDEETLPLVDVVEGLDSLISRMIQEVLEISKEAMNMVYIMEKAVQDSSEVQKALDDIFEITKVTKYLSINALIEAARAGGDTGRSFGVVATGVRDLSRRTEELAERMDGLINGLSGRMSESFALLEGIASKDMTQQIQMKERVNVTLQALIDQSERQKQILEQTATSSADISDSVSRLIMAMQFQDYAKQRMQHLVEASSEVQDKVDELAGETREKADLYDLPEELSQEAIDALLDRFLLSKLKGDFINGLGGPGHDSGDAESDGRSQEGAGQAAAEDEDDITLF